MIDTDTFALAVVAAAFIGAAIAALVIEWIHDPSKGGAK